MKNASFKQLTSLLLLALLLQACGPQSLKEASSKTAALELVNSKLFSTRSVNVDNLVFLVRLQTPALAQSAIGSGVDFQVDPEQLEKVLQEQQLFLEEIQKIDSRIEVIYSMKFVMNALTLSAPLEAAEKIRKLPMVSSTTEQVLSFDAPPEITKSLAARELTKAMSTLEERNSVTYINSQRAHEKGITGAGLSVGIIDTGIDYTHAMFGGVGTVDAYRAIDPNGEPVGFPSDKVVGGIDLVGELYQPGAVTLARRVPRPNKNPLDTRGHGTHVAGSVAGNGDGVNTYSGVAPEAKLHALKVFGAGGTSDAVVIAALEYSVDPNNDLDPSDRLDVVNLSLGGNYGKPSINYSEAVKNLLKAGVSVVASAGNSGPISYIVGAPSTSADALSVGAGIDNADWNWKADALKTSIDGEDSLTMAVEGAFSRPLAQAGVINEAPVYVGDATTDFSAEVKEALKGKIALIDRGGNPFVEKAQRAKDAGAIAVVVANNAPGEPSVMGGDGQADIPAVMISQAAGAAIKDALTNNIEVIVTLSTELKIERPEVIGTITSFSSWGPRSLDGLIKPEIVGPGQQIISADVGTGSGGVKNNGTSMSGPHLAGVMALMKQRYPTLTALEHKALVMGSANIMVDRLGQRYPVAAQGAGMVDVARAIEMKVLVDTPALSLGIMSVEDKKRVERVVSFKNISDTALQLSLSAQLKEGMTLNQQGQTLFLEPGQTQQMLLSFDLETPKETSFEYDGYIFVLDNKGEKMFHIPVLAIVTNVSDITAQTQTVMDQDGLAKIKTTLTNNGLSSGVALPFNLLARDLRKPQQGDLASIRSVACDLESVGYRIVKKNDQFGDREVLQVAAKVYEPLTDWQACMISVLIDSDNDGTPNQEIVGVTSAYLPGIDAAVPPDLYSFLLDTVRARDIRASFELSSIQGKPAVEDYRSALQGVLPMTRFNHSTVAVIEAELGALALNDEGDLRVQVAAVYEDSYAPESDDYLVGKEAWHTIPLGTGVPFANLPEILELGAGESKDLEIESNGRAGNLILYVPTNKNTLGSRRSDRQSIQL